MNRNARNLHLHYRHGGQKNKICDHGEVFEHMEQ